MGDQPADVGTARIVLTTLGSYGDLFPYLALAQALGERGHTAIVATNAVHQPVVEAAGLPFRPVRPDIDPSDAEFMRRMMDPRHGTELVMRTVIGAVREGYDDLVAAAEGADMLVTHMLTLPGPLLVRTRPALRWVSSVLAPISFFSSFDQPVLPQAPWAAPVIRWLGPAAWRALRAGGRRYTARWLGPLDALTRELGLAAGGHPLFEGQHAGDLVLALYSPILGPTQPDFPPRTVTTGFAFYDATPPGLDMPADRARAFAGRGEPPVVFTLGSSAVLAAGDFFADSVAAARRIGRRAILLVGPEPGAVERFEGQDDVLALPYLPHNVVMPLGAAVVHQGGVGTTGQALRAGRPAVVVPFSHDQPDNAARCARLGLARVVPRIRYRVATAARALRAVIEQSSYGERAAAVGVRVRGERGTANACDAIEAVLGGQRVGRQRVAVNGDD